MVIRPVVTRRDRRQFIALPYRLHSGVPQWVPPLRREVRRMFSHSNPFYEHSAAACFLAEEDGEVVGRIAVLDNTIYNRVRERRWAFFHLFEATTEIAAVELLDAASAWARERGLERLVGPMGTMPGEAMGFLVTGFDERASMSVPWTPPEYAAMVEAAGFGKEADFRSGRVARAFDVPDALFQVADAAVAEHGFEVATFDSRRHLLRSTDAVGEVYNFSFRDNWEYRPVTPSEMREVAMRFLPIADPSIIIVLRKAERLVGFLFILPEVRDGLIRARGRLFPTGWWHILRAKRTTTSVIIHGMGVIPEFQGAGANAAIYARVVRSAARRRYVSAEVEQIDEANTRMNRNLEMFGVDWTRTHRVYGRSLTH